MMYNYIDDMIDIKETLIKYNKNQKLTQFINKTATKKF